MMKAIRKKCNSAGFSLAEALVTVLILLMVSAIVAAGMPAAREALQKAVDAANAQTLLSTTATALRAELCEAADVKTDAAGQVESFRSTRTNASTALLSPTDGSIQIWDYSNVTGADATTPRPLVSAALSKSRLRTAFDSITYDSASGIFTVENLRVERGSTSIAELGDYSIKTVNP